MSNSSYPLVVTVKDVYDLAYEIAEDFDKLVNLQGFDVTRSLIQKVINVLETLESSVEKIESLEKEVVELKSKLIHLSTEKTCSDIDRNKLKTTFEETEETWNKECQNLKAIISMLRSENKLLKNQASDKEEKRGYFETTECEQSDIVLKLKTDLQKKDKQLSEVNNCNDSLRTELDQTLQLNKVLHLNHNKVQKEIKDLKHEKYEFESKLDFFEQKVADLKQALDERINQECEKKEFYESLIKENSCMKELKMNFVDMDYFLNERNDMLEKIKTLNSELQVAQIEIEKYKNKLKVYSLNDQRNEPSNIRRLFHLFLGFPTTVPASCFA